MTPTELEVLRAAGGLAAQLVHEYKRVVELLEKHAVPNVVFSKQDCEWDSSTKPDDPDTSGKPKWFQITL